LLIIGETARCRDQNFGISIVETLQQPGEIHL
jgi:hypothetical protein